MFASDPRHRYLVRVVFALLAGAACSSGKVGGNSASRTTGAGGANASPPEAGAIDAASSDHAGAASAGTGGTAGPGDAIDAAPPDDAGAPPTGTGGGGGVSSLPPAALPNRATLYTGTFSAPPKLTNTNETTDAPLLGNGDLGVAILGGIDAMTFNLHKNEFWSLSQGTVKAMARLTTSAPDLAGASYSMTEQIGVGEVTGTFTAGARTITTRTWVQADDPTQNLVFTVLALAGGAPVDFSVGLQVGAQNSNPTSTGAMGDVLTRDVRADEADMVGGLPTRRVRIATRAVGAPGTVGNDTLSFTLSPGTPVALVTSVMSNLDDALYTSRATGAVSALTPANVSTFETAHKSWWDAFYRKSFIEIPDKVVEKSFYASLYLLACASRTGEQAPGLWGNWVMEDPAWFGDYTLNYNYEAPFYAAFPTNHVDLADSYDKPVIDWLPNAQKLAAQNGWTGAYYRVHIGPMPNGSADTNEWNQKFNGAFAGSVMITHFYTTRDPAYAASIYPTLKQMAIFWQDYLKLNANGTYDIVNDAQHEGNPSPQTDGVMSLGFVRFLLQGAIDVAAALQMDTSARATWQDRLSKLSPFPTFMRNGQTVFRYTEVGLDWNNGNAIGIQHIYPASQIGLESDPTLLTTARNMVTQMGRWSDGNGTTTFFPAAARVGHDPAEILTQLDGWIQGNSYPNLHIHTGGGGIENFNTVPSTVAEMLLQSFQGKLHVFADWPATADARFGNLRAWGGFLVSSRRTGGTVLYVTIASEAGLPAVLVNPWPGATLHVYRDGADAGTASGTVLTLPTKRGEVLTLAPDGKSYADIVSQF